MSVVFVTGGAGFIGSNFVRYWLETHPDDRVVNFDLLTYAGNLANLDALPPGSLERYTFVQGSIENEHLVTHVLRSERVDIVVNFAAESHNSRAVVDPGLFFRVNVLGTQTLPTTSGAASRSTSRGSRTWCWRCSASARTRSSTCRTARAMIGATCWTRASCGGSWAGSRRCRSSRARRDGRLVPGPPGMVDAAARAPGR